MNWGGRLAAGACALLCALLCALRIAPSHAQNAPPPAAAPCPTEMTHALLLGLWRAEFEGLVQGATLLLEQHPESAGSVRGEINRNGERAWMAGDVDDGDVSLEESINGVNISAAWVGTMEEGSCGKTIRGQRQGAGEAQARGFVLRKLP